MGRKLGHHWKPVAAVLGVLVVAVFAWAATTAHGVLAVTFDAPTFHGVAWRRTARPAFSVPESTFLGGYELARASSPTGYATVDVFVARSALSDDSEGGLVAATTAQAKALIARKGVIEIGKLGPVNGRPASAFSADFPADGVVVGATVTRYNVLAEGGRVVSVVCRWYHRDAATGQQGCGDVFTSVRLHDR
jgi:hypothetical protein